MYWQISKYRRIFTVFLASLMTLTLIGFSGWKNPTQAQSVSEDGKRPNILLVVADDMGYSDLSMYGSEIAVPTLEALAQKGMMLTNFHAMPLCAPSRSVLLTGLDNHRAGVGTQDRYITPATKGQPGYEGYLNQRVVSLPTLLKDGGYHTYMAGKWHLGDEKGHLPSNQGFEQTFVLLDGAGNHFTEMGYTPKQPVAHYNHNGQATHLPEKFYSANFYTDKLIEFIDRNRGDGKPFFAYAAYTSPHDPLQAPQEYIQKYLGKYDMGWDQLRKQRFERMKQLGLIPANVTLPPRFLGVPAWDELTPEQKRYEAKRRAIYSAMIDNMDRNLGRLINHLKEIGEYDNTLIVFISDNGPEAEDRQSQKPFQELFAKQGIDNSYENMGNANSYISATKPWAQIGATPFLGHKELLSEGGIRVPAIFSYPSKIKAGSRSDAFAASIDITPTILEYARVNHPGENYQGHPIFKMNGQSLRSFIEGKVKSAYTSSDARGYEVYIGQANSALFMDGWKLLKLASPWGDGQWKLFHLSQDPREIVDLSKQEPERLAAMKFMYGQYEKSNGVIPVSKDTNLSAALKSEPKNEN